jgi:hypothetical protein
MTSRGYRAAGVLGLVSMLAAVPLVMLLGALSREGGLAIRAIHALALAAVFAGYALVMLTFRALLHARGFRAADGLITLQLGACALVTAVSLPWAWSPGAETTQEALLLVLASAFWLIQLRVPAVLRPLDDDLHGLRARLEGTLIVGAWAGLAINALSIPLVGHRDAPPEHLAWSIPTLLAVLALAIAYVRNYVTLARIFFREARSEALTPRRAGAGSA